MTQPSAAGAAGGPALVTLDGRYHVLERIAAGGMGEVFRAHDAVLAREVAVKVLHRSLASDPGFVDRFRREARAAATLNHPNIVAVYDWGAVDGIYYMVMEFVEGRSVRDLLNANGRLAPAQAAEIVRETLLALQHAHAKGIVHRDLKPENILLTTDGTVKLTDLGLARAFADARSTRAGAVTGTVQYLSPEQIRGEPADPRSDLYSLGIVTFELLTGQLPFTGETPMSIAYKHLSDEVPPPSRFAPDISPDLDGFVAAAVDKNRELRPESAAAMRRDLDAFAGSLPRARSLASLVGDLPEVVRPKDKRTAAAASAVTQTIPRVERAKRRRWRKWVGAVLALALVAGAAYGVWTYAIPHTHPIPAVVGGPVKDATTQLADLGYQVLLARGKYSVNVPKGSVQAVDPPAGTQLKEGETVTLVPSFGPPPVPVPSVVGKSEEAAKQAIVGAGFGAGDVTRVYSDTVPEGDVISQDPAEGKAPKGSAIAITVSRGHAPVAVPKVVGSTQADAEAALDHAGFKPVVKTAFSDSIDRGDVMDVSPTAGQDALYGSAVTITVSQGPEEFPAPNLVGLSVEGAKARAAEFGLEFIAYAVPGATGTIVRTQLPNVGTTIRYGATITVYYS